MFQSVNMGWKLETPSFFILPLLPWDVNRRCLLSPPDIGHEIHKIIQYQAYDPGSNPRDWSKIIPATAEN